MKRLLFVCSKNRFRSPTAEAVFSGRHDVESMSAGLNKDSDTPLTADLVAWADIIFVMEPTHKAKIRSQFKPWLKHQRLINLDIADNYGYMDKALVRLLKERVERHL